MNSKERFDCKVGNQVLYRVGKKILKGKVTAIGKPNEHQHALDMEVTWEDGKVQQLSPFDDSVAILAPQEEIPGGHGPLPPQTSTPSGPGHSARRLDLPPGTEG